MGVETEGRVEWEERRKGRGCAVHEGMADCLDVVWECKHRNREGCELEEVL